MKKMILIALPVLCLAAGGCVTNIELQKGDAAAKDTVIVGKWVRLELGKKAKWLDASVLDTRVCRGELRAGDEKLIFRIDRPEDDGFFAVKVPPGKTYSSLGIYCRKSGNMGGLAGAAMSNDGWHQVFAYNKLVTGGSGIYVLPSMNFNYGVRTNTSPVDVKVVDDGKHDDLLKELNRRFPAARNLKNIVRVSSPT